MHPDRLGLSLRTQLTAAILEVANELVSRPAVFRRQPLSERCVRLSPHRSHQANAPIAGEPVISVDTKKKVVLQRHERSSL
jgi:hypothetical protein